MSQQSTSHAVVPFTYGDTAVRTIVIGGDPWFVLADLCKVLDIANTRNVASRLAADMKGVRRMDTPGGPQDLSIVNEAGMYEVVIRSDKPDAVAFRRWITGTVLPEIRRTGSFGAVPELSEDEIVMRALTIQTRKIEALSAKVEELEPKADLADNYLLAQGGARLVREVAKILGWKEKDLRRWLIDEKLIFVKHSPCGAMQYDFYAQFAHHFQTREKVVEHQWGSCTHYTLQILPRGVELIHRRIGGNAA
ncbi:antirepressor [Gordonia phage PhorbesPhlower]|nr:antirepressor [Gordonia phage PhorbesPhlower]